jgi:hypothetical protein
MDVVEASLEGCTSISIYSKADVLLTKIRIRLFRIVGRDQARDVDQHRRRCLLICERVGGDARYVAVN